MKKMTPGLFMLAMLASLLTACHNPGKTEKETVKDNGKFVVKNGKDENDTLTYECVGCEKYLNDTGDFRRLIRRLTSETKSALNFPLSFIPRKLELSIIKEDSLYDYNTNKKLDKTVLVISKYYYIGKNAYGTEIEGKKLSTGYLQYGVPLLEEQIRLDSLKFNGKEINRSLSLRHTYDNGFIDVTPVSDKSIIVLSSLSCVDKGTWLLIKLANDEEIKLVSWNDFNCDGRSYFDGFNKEQLEKIAKNKVKSVSLVSKEAVVSQVPDNCSDYFQQVANLFSKK